MFLKLSPALKYLSYFALCSGTTFSITVIRMIFQSFPAKLKTCNFILLSYLKKEVNVKKKIENLILQDEFCATLFPRHTELLLYGGCTSLASRRLAAAVHKYKHYVPQLVRESVFKPV